MRDRESPPGWSRANRGRTGSGASQHPLHSFHRGTHPSISSDKQFLSTLVDNTVTDSSQGGFAKPQCCHTNLIFLDRFSGCGDEEVLVGVPSLGSAMLPAVVPTVFSSMGSRCRWCWHPGSEIPSHGARLLPKIYLSFWGRRVRMMCWGGGCPALLSTRTAVGPPCTHLHTHIQTHRMGIHICTYKHMDTQVCAHTYARTSICTHICTCT